jgi:hypothetical protein
LEAEIGRIVIQNHPRLRKFSRLNLNERKVGCSCHPSSGGKHKIGSQAKLAWAKSENQSPNSPEQKGLEV